ncbi:MAG: Holliday junction branch migration protein RuvA [bacterium]|nr:Holliday junction branch migration protein RuvA [bacterium]
MYAFIEGEIIEKSDNSLVIRPDGMGVGFLINIAPRTSYELPGVGHSARLYTSFQVKEDSQRLFGFGSNAEKEIFETLLKISGIGGKTALAILDLPRDRIVEAIAAGDSAVLTQVNGVGAKTAGRIVLELKDKFAEELMADWAESAGSLPGIIPVGLDSATGAGKEFAEAVEALVELGYQRADARNAVRQARSNLGDQMSAEDFLRFVLQHAG